MRAVVETPPSAASGATAGRGAGPARVLRVALVALALWLALLAPAERVGGRLPIAPEAVRALGSLDVSGLALHRTINGLAVLFALSCAGVALLLVLWGTTRKAWGVGLALLVLG